MTDDGTGAGASLWAAPATTPSNSTTVAAVAADIPGAAVPALQTILARPGLSRQIPLPPGLNQ